MADDPRHVSQRLIAGFGVGFRASLNQRSMTTRVRCRSELTFRPTSGRDNGKLSIPGKCNSPSAGRPGGVELWCWIGHELNAA